MTKIDTQASTEQITRELLRIRFAQMEVNERLKRKEFRVPVHLALGHEAIAVAVSAAMQEHDTLCLTHRNIHYNLARATALKPELDELRLAPNGVAGGRMGSMNMANPARGIVYTSSILGNDLSVSAGVALAHRVKGVGAVGFVVTGDGAMEEGAFYETLLFLKTFSLASILVVENNGWSLATRIEERRATIDLAHLAAGLGAGYAKCEGNDVHAYVATLRKLRDDAQKNRGPIVVEVMVRTLGDWRQPTPEFPDGKFINYHHGAASTVSLAEWPVIREDASDPVHMLTERFDRDVLRNLASRVHAAINEELS
jgi:TPP-dependent pyruvate/acetoin dehydrogenase alpha subunit